ncbi:MAG TPA: hypothetical protein VJT73_09415 [Polyangiaceae bacterium]|nr:hypothetical protein [Polyangiaceae bacterium]
MSARKAALAIPLIVIACNQDGLTRDEAIAALEESSMESQASAVTATPVEISTKFTIGSAVEKAAEELRGFLASELPCAKVTLAGSTVTTEWGAAGGTCAYKGLTYSGTSSFTVKRTDVATVEVDHTWTDLSNGKVKVTGTAHVTWSGTEHSRRVVHQVAWTRLSDNRTGVGSGDRTQTLIDPDKGIEGGIRIDGNRHWSGNRGEWDLAITGVEVRLQDPVPQAGSYQLTTPNNKNVTLSFARKAADVIHVTLAGPKHEFGFDVRQVGTISDG